MLYVDSASSAKRKASTGVVYSEVNEKGAGNCKLTDKQKASNCNKSKARVRVEPIFGYMTNLMNGMHVKTIGILREAV